MKKDCWTMSQINPNIFILFMEPSIIKNNGFYIPVEVPMYWFADKLSYPEKVKIQLYYNDTAYEALIKCNKNGTKLLWAKPFSQLLTRCNKIIFNKQDGFIYNKVDLFFNSEIFHEAMIPQEKTFSWSIINNDTIIKVSDKSAFQSGSGIPIATRGFWDITDLQYGDRKNIIIKHNKQSYSAYFTREAKGRTRLFWHSLTTLLKQRYANYPSFDDGDYPSLEFTRHGNDEYSLRFLEGQFFTDVSHIDNNVPDNNTSGKTNRSEGGRILYCSTKYERDPQNRKDCIDYHGTTCRACGFDFEKVYGSWGKDFIQVHHVKVISRQEGGEVEIDPESAEKFV